MSHIVRTSHIQGLINNALSLAEKVDGQRPSQVIKTDANVMGEGTTVELLEKAVADLRHAAAELEAERLNCYGWRQV